MFAVRNNMFTIMDNEFRIAEILKSKGMTQTDLAEKNWDFPSWIIESDKRKYYYHDIAKNSRRPRCAGSGTFRPSTDEHDHLPPLR